MIAGGRRPSALTLTENAAQKTIIVAAKVKNLLSRIDFFPPPQYAHSLSNRRS